MEKMQRLPLRRLSSLLRDSLCQSSNALLIAGSDARNARLHRFSSVGERDDITLEEDVERKAGWLLKLFFLGTFGFVGYQFFPYMGDNMLQQSISLLHVKDPLFKRMGASRLSRFAVDGILILCAYDLAIMIHTLSFDNRRLDERRTKVVELGGALDLLTMLETAKDDKTRKEALKALVALSHSDIAAGALQQAGAVPIIRSTPISSEYAEVEIYKSSLLKRFKELKPDGFPAEGALN